MSLFSERNGSKRSYDLNDLYSGVISELREWEVNQLLIHELGGRIYFEDKAEEGGLKEFNISGNLANPRAHFRRVLAADLGFDFDDALDFLKNLPSQLRPSSESELDLFFDYLETLFGLLKILRYNPKTKRLTTNTRTAQMIFRQAINPDLALYRIPFTMLSNGQIVRTSQRPVQELVEEAIAIEPSEKVSEVVVQSVKSGVTTYFDRSATLVNRKQALKDLADALEPLRKAVKQNLLSDDEKALFEIANNFAIRHSNAKQKGQYDQEIWYDWMFHVNLAAVLTVIRILKDQEK